MQLMFSGGLKNAFQMKNVGWQIHQHTSYQALINTCHLDSLVITFGRTTIWDHLESALLFLFFMKRGRRSVFCFLLSICVDVTIVFYLLIVILQDLKRVLSFPPYPGEYLHPVVYACTAVMLLCLLVSIMTYIVHHRWEEHILNGSSLF